MQRYRKDEIVRGFARFTSFRLCNCTVAFWAAVFALSVNCTAPEGDNDAGNTDSVSDARASEMGFRNVDSSASFAVMSREHTLAWDAQGNAPRIDVPTLLIHSDNALVPSLAKKFFENVAADDKELVWTTSKGQIDFYDDPEMIASVADRLAEHFRSRLA